MRKKQVKSAKALQVEFKELFPISAGYVVSVHSRIISKGESCTIRVVHKLTLGSWDFEHLNGSLCGTRMYPLGFPFAVPDDSPYNHYQLGKLRVEKVIVLNPKKHKSFKQKSTGLHLYFFDALFPGYLPARRHPIGVVVKAVRRYAEEHIIAEPFLNYMVRQKRTLAGFRSIGYGENLEYCFAESVPGAAGFKKGNAKRKRMSRKKKSQPVPLDWPTTFSP